MPRRTGGRPRPRRGRTTRPAAHFQAEVWQHAPFVDRWHWYVHAAATNYVVGNGEADDPETAVAAAAADVAERQHREVPMADVRRAMARLPFGPWRFDGNGAMVRPKLRTKADVRWVEVPGEARARAEAEARDAAAE